ncbi:oxaloacetate decarboxylase subunit gamma, partial [Vibrio sp. 812(2023)]|nr:oxaloacetate decarboxylase subunit gamma [Vibrio sp. 812(2023)]
TTIQSTSSAVSPQVVAAISAAIHQHRASIAK